MGTNKSDLVKNQHYVPKSYLENFTNNEQLYVFDKWKNTEFVTNIRNIASETYFYDFELDADGKSTDRQFVEKWFSTTIEGKFKSLIRTLIAPYCLVERKKLLSVNPISDYLKNELSFFLAVQILRTKDFREHFIDMQEQVYSQIVPTIAKMKYPDMPDMDIKFAFNREYESLQHAKYLFDTKLLTSLSSALYDHIWFIGVNTSNTPFYTSDNPVVKRPHKKDEVFTNNGYGSLGIEVAFPLNGSLILVMCERIHHKNAQVNENKFVPLTESHVNYYNAMQLVDSYRQIYCGENKFDLATSVFKGRSSKPRP